MTKKRKAESSLEVERNLHSSFVTAANSISQLFTQAIQQHKKAQVDGAQQALERQVAWLVKEYGNSQFVPMSALLAHLQQEIQHVDALEAQQMQAAGFAAGGDGVHDTAMGDQQKHARHGFAQQLVSPMKRQANTSSGFYNFGHNPSVQLADSGQAYGAQNTTTEYSFMPSGHQ